MHGLLGGKWEYNLGVFNGTGIDVNMAQKTLSDDLGIPSLLYAARVAFMPKGPIPAHQGRIDDLHNDKIMFALSASYNVEANWQTTTTCGSVSSSPTSRTGSIWAPKPTI